MNPALKYFQRNQGEWHWMIKFQITSWNKFAGSSLPFINKIRIASLIFAQKFFGQFSMWTNVEVQDAKNLIIHKTIIKRWGIIHYKSIKYFRLTNDQGSLHIDGDEFLWPLINTAVPFEPTQGIVESSSTRARYQMPFAGSVCDCHAFLEMPQGHLLIETPWLKGTFNLTPESNKKLESKFRGLQA